MDENDRKRALRSKAVATRTTSKKVLLISEFPPPPGGIGMQAAALLAGLCADGACPLSINITQDYPGWLRGLQGLRVVRGILRVGFFLGRLARRTGRTDVLHILSGSYANFFLYTLPSCLAGRIMRKRLIVHYHGGAAQAFFAQYGFIATHILRMADAVVVPSEFLASVFSAVGVSTVIVPNIVDTGRFAYRRRERPGGRFIIARHLEPIYNVDCALKAFAIVRGMHPEVSLTIAGDGSDRRRLEKCIADLGIESSVRLLGNIGNDQIPKLYEESDLFLNSSLVDNLPVSILEAFAAGLPVVSSDAGGIPILLRQGALGILFPAGNHQAMAASILKVLSGELAVVEMARKAYEESRKHDWATIKDAWRALYESADRLPGPQRMRSASER